VGQGAISYCSVCMLKSTLQLPLGAFYYEKLNDFTHKYMIDGWIPSNLMHVLA